MQSTHPSSTAAAETSAGSDARRDGDEEDMSAHAAFSARGPLDVADDDAGNDPYNRTGRFRRNIR